MGCINATCPVLLSEFVPKASRGRYLCAQLSVLNLGIASVYWITYGFTNYVTGSKAWRVPVALQAVPVLAILALCFICHESPRWLVSHGHQEQALKVIAELHDQDVDSPDVVRMYDDISKVVQMESAVIGRAGSWKNLLLGRDDAVKSRRRFFIACAIQGFQQLGGINGIVSRAAANLKTISLNAWDDILDLLRRHCTCRYRSRCA